MYLCAAKRRLRIDIWLVNLLPNNFLVNFHWFTIRHKQTKKKKTQTALCPSTSTSKSHNLCSSTGFRWHAPRLHSYLPDGPDYCVTLVSWASLPHAAAGRPHPPTTDPGVNEPSQVDLDISIFFFFFCGVFHGSGWDCLSLSSRRLRLLISRRIPELLLIPSHNDF